MKIVRDYLTSQELGFIVNAMLVKDNALDREIVKVGLVAQLLAEDIGEFEDCNDVYDKVVADDTINLSKIVNNYDVIDKIVAEELGVNNIIKDFTKDINNKLDNATKNMDLNGAIAQLREISEKGEVEDGSKKVQQPRRNKSVSNKGN